MSWLQRFLSSTIGLKVVMATTGLLMFGFILAHMGGNFLVFSGPDQYNHYAEFLQGQPEVLWLARMGLIGAVFGHIGSAVALVRRSRSARPRGYKEHSWLGSSYAVRTMRWGGVIVLAFIVFHLAQFTLFGTGVENFNHCSWTDGEFECFAYQNFIRGFQSPLIVGFYVVAQVFLGLHLAHGVWSMLRTLGLSNPRYIDLAQKGALAFGILVTLGNTAMPLAAHLKLLPKTDAVLAGELDPHNHVAHDTTSNR